MAELAVDLFKTQSDINQIEIIVSSTTDYNNNGGDSSGTEGIRLIDKRIIEKEKVSVQTSQNGASSSEQTTVHKQRSVIMNEIIIESSKRSDITQ